MDSCVSLAKTHKNILVMRTFSKAFGLAGVRVGYLVGDSTIIEYVEGFRTMFNISSIAQKMACAALDDMSYVKNILTITAQQRERVFHELDKLPLLTVGGKSETNLFIVKHKQKDIWSELLTKGAVGSDIRDSAGLANKGFVRLSIGDQNYTDKLISVLQKIGGVLYVN